MSKELESAKDDKQQLQKEINLKNKELADAKEQYETSSAKLYDTREKLNNINEQLEKSRSELKDKEQLLYDKIEQNQTFIRLLHKSELEGKAEDVVEAIRRSSNGNKNMTLEEWKQLYTAVDEMYPEFKNLLTEKLGRFTEEQMQVCYLIRIGLTNPQIQHLTNLPRVTIWRWVKKFSWADLNYSDKESK